MKRTEQQIFVCSTFCITSAASMGHVPHSWVEMIMYWKQNCAETTDNVSE